jgi:hypothetical protein
VRKDCLEIRLSKHEDPNMLLSAFDTILTEDNLVITKMLEKGWVVV